VFVGIKVIVYCSHSYWTYSADARAYFWASHCYAHSCSAWDDSSFLSLAG